MNIKTEFYNIAENLKPVLVKIIPPAILRKVKSKIVKTNFVKYNSLINHTFQRHKFPDGINLIGSIQANHGLGQSCRLLANELESSKIPVCLYNFVLSRNIINLDEHCYDDRISDKLKYNINLIHINPYEFCYSYFRVDKSFWEARYNIGFWLWELEVFPEDWRLAFRGLNEIWTPSEFISRNLRCLTDIPVKTMPYCVTAPVDSKYNRDYFKLPEDKFLFLTMFDSNSTMERKNPLGAIKAFKKAFEKENKNVGLIVKINNCHEEDIKVIQAFVKGYENIYFVTKSLTKIQVNSLLKCADVFISLHRAEGFGLVMAEAMLVGTPVIATDYSANTEFMNNDVACMVRYEMTTVKQKNPVYPLGAEWAEPNLLHAAEYMEKLYVDREYYEEKRINALGFINDKLSMKNAVDRIESRISEIYNLEGTYNNEGIK